MSSLLFLRNSGITDRVGVLRNLLGLEPHLNMHNPKTCLSETSQKLVGVSIALGAFGVVPTLTNVCYATAQEGQ